MSRRSRFKAATLGFAASALIFMSCSQPDAGRNGSRGSSSSEASWQSALPNTAPPTGTDGTWFWAALPQGEGARLTLIRPAGDDAWTDSLNRALDVPGALIHTIPTAGLTADQPGQIFVSGEGWAIGVLDADGRFWVDWNGRTVEKQSELQPIPLTPDSSPWRVYEGAGGSSLRGLEIARDGERVWLMGPGGQVVDRAAGQVRGLAVRRAWQVGEPVDAFSWADGFRTGEIAGELEAGLRYEVSFEDGSRAPFFFDALTAPSGA